MVTDHRLSAELIIHNDSHRNGVNFIMICDHSNIIVLSNSVSVMQPLHFLLKTAQPPPPFLHTLYTFPALQAICATAVVRLDYWCT